MQAAAVCVTGALLALVLRQGSPVLALALTLAAAVVVLLSLGESLGQLTAFLAELGRRSGLAPALLAPLYKILGIALVVRAGGDLCRDAGESALAGVVEAAGSVCALLAALPLLEAVLDMLTALL